jgi:hypothetical protein
VSRQAGGGLVDGPPTVAVSSQPFPHPELPSRIVEVVLRLTVELP